MSNKNGLMDITSRDFKGKNTSVSHHMKNLMSVIIYMQSSYGLDSSNEAAMYNEMHHY